jgi:hypothetical protein
VGSGWNLGLVPPPRIGSSETGQLLITYVAVPQAMTADTEVPFTIASTTKLTWLEPYHQAFAHYAAAQLEKLRLNGEGVQVQQQLFQGYVARFFRATDPTGPKTIRTARNYWGEVRGRRHGGRDDATPWPWRS